MKKLLSLLLVLTLSLSFAACAKPADNVPAGDEQLATESPAASETPDASDATAKPEETKKPEASKKPDATKAPDKTAEPTKKPDPTQATPEAKTLGNTLLAEFKNLANAGMDVMSIAENLMSHPDILFSAGSMYVEPGLLSGFGNTEIKDFTIGATFMPMIGSIPFIGYIFELPEGANVSAFINTLKANADLRWNICVTADEMVTGSVGNKVFFVMCPESLEE
ncbi:MAG: hypothetical protein IJO50_02705 [Clostridia bacterium]|nr:hypothetical protein [Clostridia bacterium]